MPKAEDAPAAYENPLIPNARLRQIYSAMLHLRLLGDTLAPAQRRATRGLEAALVSTVADLAAQDVVSDTLAGPVLELLSTTCFNPVAPSAAQAIASAKRRAMLDDWATPSRLAFAPTTLERIWCALGAAEALKAAWAKSKTYVKGKGGAVRQPGVVIAYVQPGEAPAALWTRALGFAAQHDLPIVFVVLPPARIERGGGPARPVTLSPVLAIAHRNTVPGIAVDANDPVALYRVAQESITRARAGGGAALIECVPFTLHGARTPPEDALPAMERYLLERGVATRTWMDREARAFSSRLPSKRRRPASKKR
jgi:acetoin:2,6-dichlorophenolindophenol oxidoreductase subunit alpha